MAVKLRTQKEKDHKDYLGSARLLVRDFFLITVAHWQWEELTAANKE